MDLPRHQALDGRIEKSDAGAGMDAPQLSLLGGALGPAVRGQGSQFV